MIDWNKPVECDAGKAVFIQEMPPGAQVRVSDDSGSSVPYWVSSDGIPQPDFLDESFTVRNKISVEQKAAYIAVSGDCVGDDIRLLYLEALVEANLLREDK